MVACDDCERVFLLEHGVLLVLLRTAVLNAITAKEKAD